LALALAVAPAVDAQESTGTPAEPGVSSSGGGGDDDDDGQPLPPPVRFNAGRNGEGASESRPKAFGQSRRMSIFELVEEEAQRPLSAPLPGDDRIVCLAGCDDPPKAPRR
jgi:hypothetical protein